MKLTKKKAIELSILKWEWIVENHNDSYNYINEMLHDIPELKILSAGNLRCGICDYNHCYDCILAHIDYNCGDSMSAYSIWCADTTKANAQAVLDLIKSIK